MHQFSFDVQRELRGNVAIEIGYVGSRSNHLAPSGTSAGTVNINQLDPKFLSLGNTLNSTVANPFFGRGATGAIGAATLAQYQLLLPFPEYTSINAATDLSHARYDSLNVKAQKRFSQGLTFSTTYTWSKNFDASFGSSNFLNASAVTAAQNAYDIGAEYSLAYVDTPHRFVATTSYELPFGRGKPLLNLGGPLNYIVGGWQTNILAIYQTGFPLAIAQSSNNNSKYGFGAQRPNATGTSPSVSGRVEARRDGYINSAAFSIAPAYTLGNLARTIAYRGPGQANWDVSLLRTSPFLNECTRSFVLRL